MIKVEVNQQLVKQQSEAFARLLVSDKETRKRVKKLIRKELKEAAKNLRSDAKDAMESDPRRAFRAVASTVYRRILGGNVNILNPRKAGARYQLIRDRKLDRNPNQRGGNRRPRSQRTEQVDTYYGKDRAFILRFIASGTKKRSTKYGNRGSIPANGWFMNVAPQEMQTVSQNLSKMIEDELAAAYKEGIQ